MSAKSRRPSRGGRNDQKVAAPSRPEMTMDELERQLLDALSQLPPVKPGKPIDPEDLRRAERRGTCEASRFLAENPSKESIQTAWKMHEFELHIFDDSPVDFTYYDAYLKTLEKRATVPLLVEEQTARPILTVMADLGIGPLLWLNWNGDDARGVGGRCCDAGYRCGIHPMSDTLSDAFGKWIAEFQNAHWTEGTLVNRDDPISDYLVRPKIILNWPDFHTRGLELAQRLKEEVGAAFRVIYEKPREDPARRIDERREVLDDGSVVPLAPRA